MSIKKYIRNLTIIAIFLTLLAIFGLSYVIYKELLPSIKNLTSSIVISKHIKLLLQEHQTIENLIQTNEILVLENLKKSLKLDVNHGNEVAYTLFSMNLNLLPKSEIIKRIKFAIKNLKLINGKGYFLMLDTNGNMILNQKYSKFEGKNVINLKDSIGDYYIKNILHLALMKNSGFYDFYESSNRKNLVYFKMFEPYQLIICGVISYNEYFKILKNKILKKFQLFVFPDELNIQIIEGKKKLFEKNPINVQIPNELNKLINKKNFVFYITYLPELKWKIVTALKKQSINNEFKLINFKVAKILQIILYSFLFGLLIIFFFFIISFHRAQRLIFNDLKIFKNYLKKIPRNFIKIKTEKLKYEEFKHLGNYANEMSDLLNKYFQELQKEKKFLESVTENSGIGITVINKEFEIEYINSEIKKILKINNDVINKKFFEIFKIKTCPIFCNVNDDNCIIKKVFKTKKSYVSYNDTIIDYLNRELPVLLIINPIIENDEVDKVVYIIKDISEERKIRTDLLKLKRAIEQAPVSIVITDTNATIEYVNPFFCKVTGYSFEEAIGNNPKILRTKYNKKYYKEMWETILSGRVWEGEFLNKKKNGKHYWERAIIGPVFDENGKIINFVAVKQDITEMKNLQKRLEIAKKQAEIANKMKSEFLANMSHEIRTPMNAIIGFIDLLYETDLSDVQKEYISIIKSSSENLLRILNDILDLSKLEAGKMDFEEREIDIRELIANCINVFSKRAREKGLALKYEIDENVPIYLKGDPIRISQVINNLISNAIKFTEKGKVGIKVSLKSKKDDIGEMLFVVYDTGIGIPEDKKDKIFESFTQTDSSVTRKYGGTGLGLTIVKKIIEVYEGKIWIESKAGQGSKFFFTLKLKIAKSLKTPKKDKTTEEVILFKDAKVLVAEDNKTNQILIKEIFKKFNIFIDIANDGIEALKKLSEKEYDLIFLDWHMPEMDGLEVVKILRKIEKGELVSDPRIDRIIIEKLKNRKFNIIALTASTMAEEISILKEAGFDHFLSKPIIKEELIKVLRKYLNPLTIPQQDQKEELEELKNFIDNDEELLKTLLESFEENFHENLTLLEEAINIKNYDEIKFIAHSIKGSAYNIKLNKIGKIAEQIENMAKEKQSIEKIKNLLENLKRISIR